RSPVRQAPRAAPAAPARARRAGPGGAPRAQAREREAHTRPRETNGGAGCVTRELWPGRPFPLGPLSDADGTNFALFSENAHRVERCLFDGDGEEERLELLERTAFNWHGYVPGVGAGQRYAYRVHGHWEPERGRRFNASKLLLDPYAKAITGPIDYG